MCASIHILVGRKAKVNNDFVEMEIGQKKKIKNAFVEIEICQGKKWLRGNRNRSEKINK